MARGRGRELTLKVVTDTAAIKKSTDATAKGIGKINKQINVMAGVFAGAFAAGAVIDFLGEAAIAAREDAREVALLSREVQNLGIDADQAAADIDLLTSAAQRMGVTDTEFRDSLKRSIRVTDDFTSAVNLTWQALEVSAALGIDSADATDLMTKAVQGNKKALKTLGIDIEDASDGLAILNEITAKYSGTLKKSKTDVDRWAIVLDELKESAGAATNDLVAGLTPAVEDLWNQFRYGFQYPYIVAAGLDVYTQAQRDAAEGTSEGVMAQKEFLAVQKGTADALKQAIEEPVEIRFPRITFPSLTDDLISAATTALHTPSNASKWKTFWKEELKPSYTSDKPRDKALANKVLLSIGDEIKNGTINPNSLPAPLRKAVAAAMNGEAKKNLKTQVEKFLSVDVKPVITIKPTFIYRGKRISNSDARDLISDPRMAVPGIPSSVPSAAASSRGASAAAAGSTTLNVHVSGVGADPVKVGREVSRALQAYRARGGTIGVPTR